MKQKRMDPYLLAGLILTGVMLLLAIVGAFWTPCSVTATSGGKFEAPSALHLLGTDKLGRDIFSRMLRGLGTTLSISLSAVLIGAGIGSLVGAVTGYFGGVVDEALMRLNDVLNAFPSFLLALTVISILGPQNRFNLILVLGLVFIPSFARVMRTAFASLRDCNYITSTRLMGAGSGRILLVHILPNTLRVMLPALTIGFNNAVLAEASMSFLRVTPIETSIGYMLSESQSMFASAPWYALGTGGAIVLLVFGVGLIGEGVLRRNGEAG